MYDDLAMSEIDLESVQFMLTDKNERAFSTDDPDYRKMALTF